MIRISFRQSMLSGFLVITLLLGWAAVRNWLELERFVEQSRRGSELALQLSAAIRELAERTVDLERSSRQFIVLNDSALLGRFDENVAHSLVVVQRLESTPGEPLGELPGVWRRAVEQLSQSLHQATPQAELVPEVVSVLNRLSELNDELGLNARRWIDDRHATMLAELEQSRQHLTRLVAAAVAGAFLVALAMSWWLARPVGRLERSIERLGESQFDEPVTVHGPDDLRRVGRRLDWLRLRLSDLESGRERTLRHVSHELKTPLTALREGIALLQEEVVGTLEESQKEVVEILQDNVMALQRDIESLLRLNAVSFEARRLCYQPLALRKLLDDVVRGRELQIQSRHLNVHCEAPAITRQLDGEKLQVALDNLLSNAIDFSPEGGVIRLEAMQTDKGISIACIDNGPGIAAEDAERIFEPFVQGVRASPEPRKGSGVGLSIVRELMTAMGGRVLLVPRSGDATGANFQIEVPCER